MINEFHTKYISALQTLFETYKGEYDPLGNAAELVIE
jgi:hypothetical protein